MKKKLIGLLVVMTMLISYVSVIAHAEVTDSGTCGDNLTWTLDSEGTLTISGTGDMTDFEMSVEAPPWYGENPESEERIKKIVIEEGVTSIGGRAFSHIQNLTEVSLPHSLQHIGYEAFACCAALTNITLPDGLTSLGGYVFADSPELEEINVDKNNAVFSSLDGVMFNKNRTELLVYPMGKHDTTYTIPYTVTSIGESAFILCNNLTSVTLPDNLTVIKSGAFEQCGNLTSITIPDGVTTIESSVFSGCSSLTDISIGCGVTSIEGWAFNSESITSITFKGFSAPTLESGVFHSNLAVINIHEGFTGYTEENGYPEYKIVVESHNYESGKCTICGVGSGTCGENLTWTLDSEGTLTISGTGDMTDYTYSTNTPWNDSRSRIKNIIIEEGVTTIGKRAFLNGKNLKTVRIPSTLKSIESFAFGSFTDNNKNLEGVYINDLGAWCNIDFYDDASNPLYGAKNLYINDELATNITIPDGTEKISKYAFVNCRSITDVNIPTSVKEIEKSAFERCFNLKSVNISDGVEKIGEYAFIYCKNLTDINIPASVTSIDYCVFTGCRNLASVEVDADNANYLSEIGVLFNKDKTVIIRYPNKKDNTSYTIPDSVTSIEADAFEGCKLLENIDIPESVNEIGLCAFEKCVNLTGLTIPEGVTELDYGMVLDCEKLTSINIPESVKSISWNVFDGTAYYNDESNWTDGALYIDNCLIDVMDTLSGDLKIKDGTRVVAATAIYYNNDITSISIPESVINIGFGAFEGTAYYKDDSNWENGVLYIDNCLIDTKNSLSGNYHVKDETRLIAETAFSGCNYITGITVPKSVKYINSEAFDGYTYSTPTFVFEAPIAPILGKDVFPYSELYPDKEYKISVHEGYTGYTAENGYPEDKIVVEPHSYENGVCTVCGAEETVPPAPLITKTDTGFTVQPDKKHENCTVYTAVYNTDGRLLRLACEPVKAGAPTDIAIDFNGGTSAKVFIWADNFEPVLKTAEPFEL